MKMLVIGGSSGLGLAIAEKYQADQISRSNGYTVPERIKDIIELSFNYDIIINCLPDNNQNKLLFPMYAAHDQRRLATYFITVGSMSWRFHTAEHSKRELFDWAETLILKDTLLKHTLLNPAYLWNSKNRGDMSLIPPKDILDTIDFLVQNRHNNTIVNLLEIKGSYEKC